MKKFRPMEAMRMNSKFVCRSNGDKVNIEVLEKIEEKLGFIFPHEYKKYVVNNNGAYVEGFFISNLEIKNETGFAFLKLEKEFIEQYELLEECTPKDVIPFAVDGGGNYYCFDYKENSSEPKIVFLDHETSVTQEEYDDFDLDEIENMTLEEVQRDEMKFIADSFKAFVDDLV